MILQETYVRMAFTGVATGLAIAFLVLLLATMNLIITFLSILTIMVRAYRKLPTGHQQPYYRMAPSLELPRPITFVGGARVRHRHACDAWLGTRLC
jgi:hypothetical protein